MIFNAANFHLIVNHWPVFLPIQAIILILVGMCFHLRQIRLVGLAFAVAGAFATLPAFFTGLRAREIIQNYPEISVQNIEWHRSMALYASALLIFVGLLAARGLHQEYRAQKLSTRLIVGILMMLILCSGIMAYTAHTGGLIRHEELLRGRF